MARFEDALAIVLTHEGGFVQNPNDSGEATNFGITRAILASFHNQACSVDDVKSLTLEGASQIYRQMYWQDMKLDLVEDQKLATVLFDMGVLQGPPTVVKMIQTILQLKPDGVMGPMTIAALNSADPENTALAFLEISMLHFVHFVTANPSQLMFLRGWIHRANDLLAFIFKKNIQ